MTPPEAFWPTQSQRLLLRTALLQGDEVLRSWTEWKKREKFEEINRAVFRIVHQVVANLSEHAIKDPLMDKMKGIYRHTWANNQRRFHILKPLLKELQAAGVKMLLLKGSSMVLTQYCDFGLRSMADFDFSVPRTHACLTIEIAERCGWKHEYRKMQAAKKTTPLLIETYSDTSLLHQSGENCDLHWSFSRLVPLSKESLEEDFWERAVLKSWDGIDLYVPSPTEQLIHTCIHGVECKNPPEIRWIVDAMMILRQPASIDWARLIELARKHQISRFLQKTLSYLVLEFQAPIPSHVFEQLERNPITLEEEARYQKKASDLIYVAPSGFRYNALMLWRAHSKRLPEMGVFGRLLRLPIFLKNLWGLEGLYELPIQLLRIAKMILSK